MTKSLITIREAEIMELIAQGLSSKEVAYKLFVSKRTVDFHLQNIHMKLNVKNRVQAIRVCQELGLLK